MTSPRCPDCGSMSFSQMDDDPLTCSRCGAEWMVQGWHSDHAEGVASLTFGVETSAPSRPSYVRNPPISGSSDE